MAIGVACFFTVMTVAEGGGRRAVMSKLRDMYVPTLKANYAVWPAVQVINFRLMPVQFQLVSAILPIALLQPLCKMLSRSSSLSCLPSVSPGLRTSRSPTLPRRPHSQTQPRSVPTTSAWSRIGMVSCDKKTSFPFSDWCPQWCCIVYRIWPGGGLLGHCLRRWSTGISKMRFLYLRALDRLYGVDRTVWKYWKYKASFLRTLGIALATRERAWSRH